jgi:uncharacterized membrane protein YfcA
MGTLLLAAVVGILLGAALGMFGGGGGILAVPLLVGLLGMDIDEAATTSLVIVLFGALAGLVSHHRAGRVLWRSGLVFGIASILGAAVGATAAAQVEDWVKLAAFTVLLVVAAVAMLRNARSQSSARPRVEPSLVGTAPGAGDPAGMGSGADDLDDVDRGTVVVGAPLAPGPFFGSVRHSLPPVILLATGTGLVTGFLGVGGGFLVVPALVLSLKMPVSNATATGLVVVAIASLSALVVRVTHSEAVGEYGLTGVLIVATVASSMLAARFSGRLSPRRLTTGFALLVLGMSFLVAYQAVQAFEAA